MIKRPASIAAALPALLLTLPLALPLTGCGGSDGSSGEKGETLTVFAAASLTTAFTRIGHSFEAEHPGVTVRLSFGGSADLAQQIEAGAPADVFASADEKNMDKLAADVVDRADFASNTLEIATPPGNPARVRSLRDLARDDLKLVVCAPEVPCGAAAATVARTGGVRLHPVSQEQSVTDVLGKVTAGEADAGLVYVTDVRAAGDEVTGIELPEAAAAVTTYPIAALDGSPHPDLAAEFTAYVLDEQAQGVLADAGFGKP